MTSNHTTAPPWPDLDAAFSTLVENIVYSVTLIDRAGIIRGFNKAAANEAKVIFDRDMQSGDSIRLYLLPQTSDGFEGNFARALAGERVCVTLTFPGQDNHEHQYEFVYAPIVGGDGQVTGICFTVRNISEQIRADSAMRQLRQQNQVLLDAVSDGIVGLDRGGNCLYINRAAMAMLQTTAADEIGQHFHTRHHLDDNGEDGHTWDTCMMRATLQDGRQRGVSAGRFRRSDDSIAHFDYVATPILEDDAVSGAVLTLHDVSEQVAAAAALRKSEERFRGIVEHAHEGITLTDEAGTVIVWNDAMAQLTGWTEAEVIGRKMWEVQAGLGASAGRDPHRSNYIRSLVETTLATGHSPWVNHPVEQRLRRADGEERVINSTMFAVPTGDGFSLAGFLRDITETRRVQNVLIESEQRLALALDASNYAIFDWDIQGDRVYWSPNFPQMLGYGPDEMDLNYVQMLDLVHPDDIAAVETVFNAYNDGRSDNHELEARLRTKTGAYHWILSRGKLTRASDGAPVRVLGTFSDVTERKLVNETLVARNRELTTLFHISEILLADKPLRAICDDVLAALLDATAMDEAVIELYEVDSDRLTAPADLTVRCTRDGKHSNKAAAELAGLAMATGKAQVSTAADPGGQTKLAVPIYGGDHVLGAITMAQQGMMTAPEHLVNLVQNVANHLALTIVRRKTTEQLHERVEEINCLYEITRLLQSPRSDVTETLQEVADLLPRVLRVPAAAQIEVDRHFTAAVDVKNRRRLEVPIVIEGVRRGSITVYYHCNGDAPEKESVLFEAHALLEEIAYRVSVYFERSDNIAKLMAERASLEDRVAERTAQLAEANAELAQAARLKDEFLANMSHELRTPLTGILGLAEALQMPASGALNERQLRSIKLVESSGRHLLDLINDILDVAKVEAGKIDLQPESIAVMGLCQECLQLVSGVAAAKHQTVSCTVEPSSLAVNADRRRLKQMLVNLLSNAVKFTGDGGQLGLDVTADAADGAIQFMVWDTGIGIAAQHMDKLFRPFVQLDSSLSRKYAGTGLGLILVKRMAELHGGAVSVESSEGKGSRFTITLPWKPGDTFDTPAVANELPAPPDSPPLTNRLRLLMRIMRRNGALPFHRPLSAEIVSHAAMLRPEAILVTELELDAKGTPIWQILQNDPRTQTIPLLLAAAPDTQVMRWPAAVRALPHNFTVRDLEDALHQVSPPGQHPRIMIAGSPGLRPRILVVEDSETTQQLLQNFLDNLDYAVVAALDGEQAIAMMVTERPDIVLMDIQMPGIDGLEATRRIRALGDPYLRHTPILAVTALVMPGDAERCLAAGANSYLAKPFNLPEVAQKIEEFLAAGVAF